MADEVRVTDRERVRWIELDRPATRNGLTPEQNRRILELLGDTRHADTGCVVLGGARGSFCSGADLSAASSGPPPTAEERDALIRDSFHAVIRALRALPMPTLAAVDGVAAGFGCDLALACDIRLLSERARFCEVFVRRGLMPDGGGTHTLPRLVGLGPALELMLGGEIIDATEAVRLGLARRVVPTADFEQTVWSFATALAQGPPLAHRAIKRSVYAALHARFDDALDREREGQLELLQTEDFREGVRAFLAKRAPVFRGR